MPDNQDIKYQFYKAAMQLLYDEERLQFQRFNFFLAATAFLIAAYAYVATSSEPGLFGDLTITAHVINGIALFLAIWFTWMNYENATIITTMFFYVLEVEAALKKAEKDICPPLARYRKADISGSRGITGLVIDIFQFLKSPRDFSSNNLIPHTWFLPLLFVAIWLASWIWISWPCWYIPVIFLFALFAIYLIPRLIGSIKRRHNAKKASK
jgi:hypothetical protein